MNNLRADIAGLFAELDGRDRYEDRIEQWCDWSREQERQREADPDRRKYQATWRRTRYHSNPVWREQLRRYNNEWRWKRGTKPRVYGPVAVTHGLYATYIKHKCRCAACRAASAAYMRNRRAELAHIARAA